MEPLGNNHGFIDGNKCIAFTSADVFLRGNGFFLEVDAVAGYDFINNSMERQEFRYAAILAWLREHRKPL